MTKKEEVINASRNLFETYGFKKVTMDEIARESNVSKKTIYSYFKDKDDLVKYFLKEELQKMKNIIETTAKEDIPFADKIHEIIYNLLSYRKEEKLLRLFTEEAKKLPFGIANECSNELTNNIMDEIQKLVKKAIEEKYIQNCDPKLTSFIIYKLYFAIMFEYDGSINKKEVTEKLMYFLKNGLFN